MFALQLLGPPLAYHMAFRIQMPAIGTPAVGIKAANAQWCEQGFESEQCPIFTPTEDIRHHPPRLMIQRLPEPPRPFLAPHEGPHLVHLRFLDLTDYYRSR